MEYQYSHDGDSTSMIVDGDGDDDASAAGDEKEGESRKKPKLNLIDQYLAFLLVILEEAGLFNVRFFLLNCAEVSTVVCRL
jgi:hypothetical protein